MATVPTGQPSRVRKLCRRVRKICRARYADGNRKPPTGSGVPICRRSRRGDLPTATGDRRNRGDSLPQPSRVRSAATVRRGNRSDGHAPTVPADRFGQSPRPIFRRSRVRRPDLSPRRPTVCRQAQPCRRVRRGDLPTVTGAPADGHAVKTKCAYNRHTFPRRMFQPWRGSTFTPAPFTIRTNPRRRNATPPNCL